MVCHRTKLELGLPVEAFDVGGEVYDGVDLAGALGLEIFHRRGRRSIESAKRISYAFFFGLVAVRIPSLGSPSNGFGSGCLSLFTLRFSWLFTDVVGVRLKARMFSTKIEVWASRGVGMVGWVAARFLNLTLLGSQIL